METSAFIYEWLDKIHLRQYPGDSLSTPTTPPHKRAHPLNQEPADNDEASTMSGPPTPNKRRRVESGLDESEPPLADILTRIAALEQAAQLSPSRSPSLIKSSIKSTPSNASSPLRKFPPLNLANEGIVKRQLTGPRAPHLPEAIKDALLQIQRFERCKGVLAPGMNTPDMDPLLEEFDLDHTAFSGTTHEGSWLTPETVEGICSDAQRCFEMGHDEAVWNIEVHHPLLREVFRTGDDRLVDFSLW